MAEHGNSYVHTEGDIGGILFQMPSMSRELREGDIFKYTNSSGTTEYRVETVEYRIEEISGGTPSNPGMFWRSPEVYYGVSVV